MKKKKNESFRFYSLLVNKDEKNHLVQENISGGEKKQSPKKYQVTCIENRLYLDSMQF